MKIALFLPNATFDLPGSPEVGGIETFSYTIGEALQKRGHEVVLFGGTPKFGRTHRPTTLTLELHPYWETKSIPDLGTRFQRLVQRLHFGWSIRHAWQLHQPDLVLLAKPFDWPVAWFWKRKRPGLKTIMGFHGTDYFGGDKKFFSAIDASFAVGRRVVDLAYARVGVRPVLIPNPVDTDFFAPGKPPAAGPWHLVSSARLVGWKGLDHLLRAVARLRDEHRIAARVTIAGEGPERDRLIALIAELKLQTQATLPGRLNPTELRELLRSAHLYVLPSVGMEAFSISALEAACTGLPLLLSDQVGLADYLDAQDAVIYPARDIGALTAALVQLHARRDDAAWTDAAARHARMEKQFSPVIVAQQILALVGA